MAFQQQGPESERLTGRPINPLPGFDRLALLFQLPRDFRIDAELGRHARQRKPNFLQRFRGDGGRFKLLSLIRGARRAQAGPMAFKPIRLIRPIGLGRLKRFLKPRIEGIQHSLRRFSRH